MKGKVSTESVQTFHGGEKHKKPKTRSREEDVDTVESEGEHVVVVSVSKGSTHAANYSSVRCDVSVALPVKVALHGSEEFSSAPIRAALKRAGSIAEKFLSEELDELKTWLE